MSEPVQIDRRGDVAYVSLCRPDKRNALNGAMWQRLATLIAEADADPQIKVIVITGEGQAFAAGADIDEFNAVFTDPSAAETTAAITYQAQKALHRNLKPTIAKIRGACVGGGCGIALCCDLRFADTSAKLGITPGKLADLVVLHRDIFAVPPAEIASIRPAMTVFDGEVVYDAGGIE